MPGSLNSGGKSYNFKFKNEYEYQIHPDAALFFGEVVIETTLNEGLLKDIPVISTIVGAGKLVANVRDYLLVNKLISFLNPIKDTDVKDRINAIEQWEKDSKYRVRVGETLLGMIDRCDSRIKAGWLSRLFYELVLKRQMSDLFMRAEKILSAISVMDMLERDRHSSLRSERLQLQE